jgi:hypothetical protein
MSWIDKLDIESAINRIQSEERSGKDFCLDPLRFEDLRIESVKKIFVDSIKNKLEKIKKSGGYDISELISIDVPKSNFILRPAARPVLSDWVIYDSLVNFIASKIYSEIPICTFSFNRPRDRYKKGEKKYKASVDYWLNFEKAVSDFAKQDKYKLLLTTDITSFFENISIDVLATRLKTFSNDTDYIKAVGFLTENILRHWTRDNKITGFGLPQGSEASLILADIYLYELDKEMTKKRIRFFRWMDDFRLFAKNEAELKRNISLMVRKLRELKLNLNAKKTSIYSLENDAKLREVIDPEKERLNLISTAIKSKSRQQIDLILPSLLELKTIFKQDDNRFSERHLRFFISSMVDLMRYRVLDKKIVKKTLLEFLNLFDRKPNLSKELSWFFVCCSKYSSELRDVLKNFLVDFICDANRNIYEWQEMWALDVIRQVGGINRRDLKKIGTNYFSENNLCYMQFCLLQGKYGNNSEREEILNRKKCEQDQYRSTLLATQELNEDVVRSANLVIPAYFRKYVENLKGRKYGFETNMNYEELDKLEYQYFS